VSLAVPAWIRMSGWALVGFLYLPLFAVAAYSLNSARFGLRWESFTWVWYQRLFDGPLAPAIREATVNSLLLALLSTALATVLGTGLAFSLRAPWRRWQHTLLTSTLLLPVVAPDIIIAAALVALRQGLGWLPLGFGSMVVGHVVLEISFVALVVNSRLVALGSQQEEAARDLYASRWFVLRRVVLPQIAPAIVAGAMLACALSLDDFVISFMTGGSGDATLATYLQASLRRGVAPELHALSTLLVLASVILVIILTAASRTNPAPESR
jgi:spermidine/putrescine transport system permease protein